MRTNDLITRIWRALATPAASYAEITDRVNEALSYEGLAERVNYGQINMAIFALREADPSYYGWIIPHCKRGPTSDGRLFRARFDAKGALLSDAKGDALVDGTIGVASHVMTMMEHAAKMMKGIGPQLADLKLRRAAKSMVRKMEFVSAEASDMVEALVAQRPNGTDGTV